MRERGSPGPPPCSARGPPPGAPGPACSRGSVRARGFARRGMGPGFPPVVAEGLAIDGVRRVHRQGRARSRSRRAGSSRVRCPASLAPLGEGDPSPGAGWTGSSCWEKPGCFPSRRAFGLLGFHAPRGRRRPCWFAAEEFDLFVTQLGACRVDSPLLPPGVVGPRDEALRRGASRWTVPGTVTAYEGGDGTRGLAANLGQVSWGRPASSDEASPRVRVPLRGGRTRDVG